MLTGQSSPRLLQLRGLVFADSIAIKKLLTGLLIRRAPNQVTVGNLNWATDCFTIGELKSSAIVSH